MFVSLLWGEAKKKKKCFELAVKFDCFCFSVLQLDERTQITIAVPHYGNPFDFGTASQFLRRY